MCKASLDHEWLNMAQYINSYFDFSDCLNFICISENEVTQLCPTLCDPMDCSLSGYSIHGIFQARVLEWVAISFSNYVEGNTYVGTGKLDSKTEFLILYKS